MERIDARVSELGEKQVRVAEAVGRDGPAFNAWRDGTEKLSVNYAVGICNYLGLCPAWAMFNEGLKTRDEAIIFQDIRLTIASLATDVRRVAEHAQYVPQPHLKSEAELVGTALAAVMSETRAELPDRVWTALESAATLVHHLSAPQVAICRSGLHLEEREQSEDGPQDA